MKRALVASILGLAASVASSFGQGAVNFSNYSASPYYPVAYSTTKPIPGGATAGQGVGATFNVELGYFIGTTVNPAQITLLPSSITAINPALMAPPGGVGSPTTGYFIGPTVAIPGYSSGPVTFEILAWQGATYAGASVITQPNRIYGLSLRLPLKVLLRPLCLAILLLCLEISLSRSFLSPPRWHSQDWVPHPS